MTRIERPFVRPSVRKRADAALAAEPRLQAIERLVDALCALVRPADTMCFGCVWESIIKPLTVPLVGWERGYPPEQAHDPGTKPLYADIASILDRPDDRPDSETETEAWLRTAEAWDAVTDRWLSRLEKADPGNGCGVAHR